MPKIVKYVTSSDGLKLYADSNGNVGKTPIVFIHGFRLTGAVFDRVFEDPEFTSKFYLIRYDLRGQGRTGVPENAEGHISKLYADDFAAICDAFEVKKPYTVGWSYGCTILSDISTHLPHDYLSGSVYLAGPPFLGEDLVKLVTPGTLTILPRLSSTTHTAAEFEDAISKFTEWLFSTPEEVPIETKWLWRGMMSSAPPASYAFALLRNVDPTATYVLGKKGYPLHVIAGTDEQLIIGANLVELLQPHFPKLTWHYVEGGGHSVFHQNVRETIESITKFVTENRWTDVPDSEEKLSN